MNINDVGISNKDNRKVSVDGDKIVEYQNETR